MYSSIGPVHNFFTNFITSLPNQAGQWLDSIKINPAVCLASAILCSSTVIMSANNGGGVNKETCVRPNPGKTLVYVSTAEDGTTQYVGITENIEARSGAHLSQKGIEIAPYLAFKEYPVRTLGRSSKSR